MAPAPPLSRAPRVAAVVAAGLACALPAWAADEALVLRQRAEQLAAQDRCDEAIPRAQRARELAPDDARAAWIAGRCLLRQGRYGEAVDALRDARTLDPSLPGVSADLAQSLYHLDRIPEASAELDRAEQEDPDDARVQLYRGLVLLREAKEAEAGDAFDRASRLDPDLAGAASLYSGRSWEAARDREKAAAAHERARAADPDSEWAQEAERELERLDAPYQRRVWARMRGGYEYDTNVPLRWDGMGSLRPLASGSTEDVRFTLDGDVGGELLRSPERTLGVSAGYSQSWHLRELAEFDLRNPWLSLWYDERLGEDTWLRLQPFGGYAWLASDPYDGYGGLRGTLSHRFCESFAGELYVQGRYDDFLYRIPPDTQIEGLPPPGGPGPAADARRRRNPDGTTVEVGVEGIYDLARTDTTLRFGTAYDRRFTEGDDWDRDGSHSWIGIRQPLPVSVPLRFEAEGGFYYHPYDHRSSYQVPVTRYLFGLGAKRIDRIWEVETELTWDITRWLALSARWNYLDSDSNVEVFDYDRHIVGGYLTVYLDNER